MKENLIVPGGRHKIILGLCIVLISVGFTLMAIDQAPYGFGFLSLTLASLLILSGLCMPFLIICKFHSGLLSRIKSRLRNPHILTGWSLFLLTLILYIRTLEPTASLWDCGEYIACAYKLQIPHAPGNPLFTLLGHLFSLFALGNRLNIAYWVNMLSALSSAATIMFIFWTIEILAFRIQNNLNIPRRKQSFNAVVAGLTGALIFGVSDSFWFSAVEAETYALATFFTILPVWTALKWEKSIDRDSKVRWFLLLAYTYGLAIGAHQMALLTIPAATMVFYQKSRKENFKNLILGTILGIALLFLVSQLIILGFPSLLKWLDIMLVNGMGLPFNSGIILGVIFLVAVIRWIYKLGIRKSKQIFLNISFALVFIFIGFSTYLLIPIRSIHNPPIDENNPDNISSLVSYLGRDSYPQRPLFFGPYFDASVKRYQKTTAIYTPGKQRYRITDHHTEAVYDSERTTFLPRMYSDQEDHITAYRRWSGLKTNQKPVFSDNLTFMFRYQLGHMYLRYFMWNFAGRESDIIHAGWLSPFAGLRHRKSSNIHNRAHNNYFMLPFLLGLIGFFQHWKKDRKTFYAFLYLFLFTGIILVLYLNSTPNEPRERDYIYVGSYLSYAIWCGLGALTLVRSISSKKLPPFLKYSGLLLLFIPAWMCYKNFDDHDRSRRYLQIDHARNILASCKPDAILFTGGDNDTFPLWYVQEVEGFRTDVRVIVLSYFNASWYIEQMTRKAYQSDPLPISLSKENIRQGGCNDILPVIENPDIHGAINLLDFLQLIREGHPALKVSMSDGDIYNSVPSRSFYLPVNVPAIENAGIIPSSILNMTGKKIYFEIKGNYLTKNTLMVLDIIAHNHWNRPIYFNYTSINSIGIDVSSHIVQTGNLYLLLPIEHTPENIPVDQDQMYENLMIKARYHDLDNAQVYYNTEDFLYRIIQPIHHDLNTLAETLITNGRNREAREVTGFIYNNLKKSGLPFTISWLHTAELFYRLDEKNIGNELTQDIYDDTADYLHSVETINVRTNNNLRLHLYIMQQIGKLWENNGNKDKARQCQALLRNFSIAATNSRK